MSPYDSDKTTSKDTCQSYSGQSGSQLQNVFLFSVLPCILVNDDVSGLHGQDNSDWLLIDELKCAQGHPCG